MKIGVMTDGDSEVYGLPELYPQIRGLTRHVVLNPIKADIQPDSSAALIAKKAARRMAQLRANGARMLLLLIDREGRRECPGAWANAIHAKLNPLAQQAGFTHCRVVVKDRMLENWLIADPAAFGALPKRFTRPVSITPGRADNANADAVLRSAGDYQKPYGAREILRHASVPTMRANSRSFERLIRRLA
jgi:hypothetical protein